MPEALDEAMLLRACRAAWRGVGRVEPNPPVGCVIGDERGNIFGTGHHRAFGAAHAEVEALRACGANNRSTRGATAWVTLEPCAHTAKTPPCTDALIEAGIARVVCARRDPHPDSRGGAAVLEDAGIPVTFVEHLAPAQRLTDPFLRRVTEGMPWVVAKWAQTIDGRIATRTGDSKWISGEASRRRVHALRARADAVLTGIGTVLRDDPLLTARGTVKRRTARRAVLDPGLDLALGSRLVSSIDEAPLTVFTTDGAAEAGADHAAALREAGVEVVASAGDGSGTLDLRACLRHLAEAHDTTNVLVEAGRGLLSSLFAADLVDEACVFIAPLLLADAEAIASVGGRTRDRIRDADRLRLACARRCGDDVLLWYQRCGTAGMGERSG